MSAWYSLNTESSPPFALEFRAPDLTERSRAVTTGIGRHAPVPVCELRTVNAFLDIERMNRRIRDFCTHFALAGLRRFQFPDLQDFGRGATAFVPDLRPLIRHYEVDAALEPKPGNLGINSTNRKFR